MMIRYAEQINCKGERKQYLSEGRNNENWNLCHLYINIFVCMNSIKERNGQIHSMSLFNMQLKYEAQV
jgi:hypothetical protein